MENINIKLKDGAKVPVYSSKGAACFDLFAHTVDPIDGNSVKIGTGVFMDLPAAKQLLVFSRSGQGFKDLTRLANCVGVIDPDYTGEIAVKLVCDSPEKIEYIKSIKVGDKIAQAQLVPIIRAEFNVVDDLNKTTERGSGGFGSTGN